MMLNESTIYEGLRAYIAEDVLHGEDSGLDRSTPLLEWGVIDSITMVALLSFIEERWGVQIPDDDVKPAHFVSLDALTQCVLRANGNRREPKRQSLHDAPILALEPYGVEQATLDVQGTSLHYLHVRGKDPAWVFLPALGNPASSWGLLLRNISDEYRGIALDFAGFGLTTGPNPAPTFADQLALALEAIDRLTSGPVVLLGHSAGSMVAVEIARRFPERVRALIVTSFGAIAEPHAWWSQLRELSKDPDAFVERAYHTPPKLGATLRSMMDQSLGSPAYQSFLDERALEAMPSLFDGVTVPTMFVSGEDDRIIPRSAVTSAASAVPGARIEWLARCGHFPLGERPQELLALVHLFLGLGG